MLMKWFRKKEVFSVPGDEAPQKPEELLDLSSQPPLPDPVEKPALAEAFETREFEHADVRSLYDKHWNWFLTYLRHTDQKANQRQLILNEIAARFAGRESLRVLDIGAGDGTLSLELAKLLAGVYTSLSYDALEQSAALFRILRNRTGSVSSVNALHANWETFATDKPYDCIICVNALAAMDPKNEPLKKMMGFLAPGGLLIVIVDSDAGSYTQAKVEFHQKRYQPLTAERLEPALNQLGRPYETKTISSKLVLAIPGESKGLDAAQDLLSLIVRQPFSQLPEDERERLSRIMKKHVHREDAGAYLTVVDKAFVVKK